MMVGNFAKNIKSEIISFLFVVLALTGGSCNEKSGPAKSIKEERRTGTLEEKDTAGDDANCLNGVTETKFEIKGGWGCVAFIPYELAIHQKGQSVTYDLNGKEGFIDYERFRKFREVYSSIGLCHIGSSYGAMQSTADFRGDLIIEITNDKGSWNKKIAFVKGKIEDKKFKSLLESMIELAGKQERPPGFP